MKTAIVTFTVGDTSAYERFFLPSVRAYAQRIGADFHQIREPIVSFDLTNKSPLIRKHLFCIQKMLIPSLPWVQEYDWILLIDADILVNFEKAPNIFEQVPDGKIGGVDEKVQYGYKDWSLEAWRRFDPRLPGDAEGYYRNLGFDQEFSHQVNGGFLVFQPRVQKEFFKGIYDKYAPRILNDQDLDGDQGPLNYEGWKANKLVCLDQRWNRIWIFAHVLLYPFLNEQTDRALLQQALKAQFELNYCIHMAGHVGWSLLS